MFIDVRKILKIDFVMYCSVEIVISLTYGPHLSDCIVLENLNYIDSIYREIPRISAHKS